jgi:c(7)-type cytochrome triheme protein
MRYFFAHCAVLLLVVGIGSFAADKGPEKLVFEAKTGNITYLHDKHLEREKGNCKACHEVFFPQKKAPLNYKVGMHKVAETKKISCAGCHHTGGKAFETKGNCTKCHVKAGAKA